ncbi:MAG: hypothetical protein HYY85_15290 [Deltaproteobacteria bacterium]|nr:hypothetical protein [Deltaproteobacteria bacterium]
MARTRVRGWLFDLYPDREGMVVWLLTEEHEARRLLAPFTPAFYVSGPDQALRRLLAFLAQQL